VAPALPTGLSLASNGILSGTPTALQSATSYTVTGQDEYGRETTSTFTIEVADTAFDPATLFASGEVGAWFEPSDTTAFAAKDDMTPCGVGDTCGFLLDKSQGAWYSGGSFTGLGSELVTNGTFDTDTSQGAQQAITCEIGKFYVFSYESTSGLPRARIGSSTNPLASVVLELINVSGGTYVFEATATTMYITVTSSELGTPAIFDNISVCELPGNHATQATAAARPTLEQTVGGVWYLDDDEVDDAINWTAPTDTDYTISYVNTAGTVTTLTSQSLSGATDILLDPALVGYLAVDRALTAGETTSLETYLGDLV